MPGKQNFKEDVSHGASMEYLQRTSWGLHEIMRAQKTEGVFAPFHLHGAELPTATQAFYGLGGTHMSHCSCALDKKQCVWNRLKYISIPDVLQGRAAPHSIANTEHKGDASENRLQGSQSIWFSVSRADNISNPCAQPNVQGDSACFQLGKKK